MESDEDLNVEGRVEGGPLHVRGRLTVAARGIVLAEEAEVREAMIVGVFVGNLHANEVVRIHQDGRLVGDVVAPRVVFVSDKPLNTERHRAAKPAAPPPAAVASPPAPEETAVPEPAPTPSEAPRSIPPLPGLGQRSMQRKE